MLPMLVSDFGITLSLSNLAQIAFDCFARDFPYTFSNHRKKKENATAYTFSSHRMKKENETAISP